MKNIYHNDIMDMLLKSGKEGMSLRMLTRRLYNIHSGIFAHDVVFPNLYNQVRRYLWYQSQQRYSPFIRLRWGQYALKQDVAVQLDIFIDMPKEDDNKTSKSIRKDDSRQLLLFN